MFSMLMGSPSSPRRAARLRALYRKQYLTPTMILHMVLETIWRRTHVWLPHAKETQSSNAP